MPRNCQACGKPLIQREEENPYSFAKRRSCDRACAVKAASVTRLANQRNAKLTVAQIPEIRAALAQGRPVKEIATAMGVNPSTIHSIRRGTSWKHVP